MDKYDEAIEYLKAHPSEIYEAWGNADNHPAGILFSFCGYNRYDDSEVYDWSGSSRTCGCLTQIRIDFLGLRVAFVAPTRKLTQAIGSDDRIPSDPSEITVEDLPVFAEWQRRLDEELGRV